MAKPFVLMMQKHVKSCPGTSRIDFQALSGVSLPEIWLTALKSAQIVSEQRLSSNQGVS